MNHFFADSVESGVLGQIRDIAVHLAVHLDVLYYVLAVCFKAAVEVVQVIYSAYFTCRCVKQLCGDGLRQGVVALLLISRNKVVAVFGYHSVKFRYLVGRVLQVGIHCYHHVALCFLESAEQGRTFSVVAAEFYALHAFVLLAQPAYHLPRTVGRAVVDEYYFIREIVFLHHTLNPCVEFG